MVDELTAAGVERLKDLLTGAAPLPSSIHLYRRSRQAELARDLQEFTPIYLDSCFWFDLRRAEDEGSSHKAAGLLVALREAVHSGRAFCPISASTFMEMLQHADAAVRSRIARLVDELSLGVSIISLDELFQSEVEWLLQRTKDVPLDPRVVPLWTKLSHALGTFDVPQATPDPRAQLALEVASLDMFWEMTLEKVAGSDLWRERPDSSAAARQITEDSQAHVGEVPDFEAAYAAEARGVADVAVKLSFGRFDATMEPAQLKRLIAAGLIQDKARHALRSMHVRACWHAIFRHNRARQFKPNDFIDIEHAACGTGYAKAFFTERSLASNLTQAPVSLSRFYDCCITSDWSEAEQFVRALG